ncbi:unnamed protein product, partial [marine sediment metagenome]
KKFSNITLRRNTLFPIASFLTFSFSFLLGELEYKKKELVNKINAWQNEKINAKQELDELSRKVSEIEELLRKINKQKQRFEDEIKIVKKKN